MIKQHLSRRLHIFCCSKLCPVPPTPDSTTANRIHILNEPQTSNGDGWPRLLLPPPHRPHHHIPRLVCLSQQVLIHPERCDPLQDRLCTASAGPVGAVVGLLLVWSDPTFAAIHARLCGLAPFPLGAG